MTRRWGEDFRPFSADTAGDLEFLLFRQDGVITRRQARRHFTDKAVRHRVESGRWRQVHRAVYVAHTGPITDRQRLWIASLGVGNGSPALLAGLTALRSLGLRDSGLRAWGRRDPGRRGSGPGDSAPRDSRVGSRALRGQAASLLHVIVPASRVDTDPPAGVVVHRSRVLTRVDAHLAGAPPCTMPARSMIDAAQWAGSDSDAVAVIAATFQQRLVGSVDVLPVLARMGRLRRRAVIEAAVADAAGGAESAYEIDFVRLCRRARLPEPSRQATRTDRDGRRRYRDVFFDEWQVQVEIDGGQHMDVQAWHADMRDHNEAAISGVRLLRFPNWALRHRPAEVIADVRAALEAAGWREPP